MKRVCNNEDCPRYYLCQTAECVMEQAVVLNYGDICNESNNYTYFKRNSATVKSLNEVAVALAYLHKKKIQRIKNAIDILLEEE